MSNPKACLYPGITLKYSPLTIFDLAIKFPTLKLLRNQPNQ